MRNLVASVAVVVVSALLAACGSSSSSSSNNGPQRPTAASVSGTIAGHPFTATHADAVAAGSGSSPCNIGGMPVGAKAIEVAFTTSGDACTALNTAQCHATAGGQKATVVIASAAVASAAAPSPPEPPLPGGMYNVVSDLLHGTATATGLQLAYAETLSMDPSCVGSPVRSVSGQVWLDPVASTTTTVTGAVSISFADGSTLSGNFSASLCGSAPNVCDMASALAGAGLCTEPVSCP